MLIDSKFRDYYDGIKAYGIDKTVVYRRETKGRELKKKLDPELPNSISHWSYTNRLEIHYRLIGFCGKLYPFLETSFRPKEEPHPYRSISFAQDAAIQLAEEAIGRELSSEDYLRGDRPSINSVEGIKRAFSPDYTKQFERYFLEGNAPVFIVGEELRPAHEAIASKLPGGDKVRWDKDCIEFNPRLGHYGFQRVVPPVQAFQEIYMYISGVLGTGAPETVEIDDKHKAISHGHDGAYSFRKPPGGGRWR